MSFTRDPPSLTSAMVCLHTAFFVQCSNFDREAFYASNRRSPLQRPRSVVCTYLLLDCSIWGSPRWEVSCCVWRGVESTNNNRPWRTALGVKSYLRTRISNTALKSYPNLQVSTWAWKQLLPSLVLDVPAIMVCWRKTNNLSLRDPRYTSARQGCLRTVVSCSKEEFKGSLSGFERPCPSRR